MTNTTAEPAPAPPAATWARLIGTFFGIGHLKPAPGTWASLATVGIWRAFAPFLPPGFQAPVAVAAVLAVTALGIPAATRVARATGEEDPSQVVIDEVAGQMLALIAVPLGWKSLLASLILFRAFDIVKPPPVRRLESFPGGFGIVADDLGAGLYALAVMQVLLHYGFLR
jgi:phosphatidylglycerophosphatase A